MNKIAAVISMALLFLSTAGGMAYAQAPAPAHPPTPELTSEPPAGPTAQAPQQAAKTDLDVGGPVSCFDYYAFDSVQAHLSSDVSRSVSGGALHFTGTLANANSYPIVDGTLYVKVFRVRASSAKNVNGPYVVDQYVAQDNFNIPAGSSIPVSFAWKIPSYAQSGDYQLATFFTTSHKYSLLGLTFTDDVVGNTVDFKVVGEQSSTVSLDKDSVTVGSAPFQFASPVLPHVAATSPAVVGVDVTNTTDTDQVVPVTWQVYAWDQQSDPLASQTTQVSVKAHSKTRATYTVTDTANPVYLVVGTAQYHDSKSVIDVRFTRDGIDKLRLNFPSLTMFPLTQGQPATMFSCFHNTAMGIPNGTLGLVLYDDHHHEITRVSYSAPISGDMHAIAKRFTPQQDYDHVTLEATLSQNGKQVDHDTIKYDCDKIDPSSCRSKQVSPWDVLGSTGGIAEIIGGVIVILLLLIAVRYVNRYQHSPTL